MKKAKYIFLTLIIVIISIFINSKIKESQTSTLSVEEKKSDAVYLLNFLENNYPFYELKKQDIGYDYIFNKENIINKIADSKNDSEFYINIWKTIRLLQNVHTEVIESSMLPSTMDVIINSSDVSADLKQIKDKMVHWDNIMFDAVLLPDIEYKYIEGKYIVIKSSNPDINIGDIINEINGLPIESYIVKNPEFILLKYDFYRNIYYSNDIFTAFDSKNSARKINVTIIDKDGNSKDTDVNLKKINLNKYMSEHADSNINIENISTKIIVKNNIAYIKINSMNFSDEDEVKINNFYNEIRGFKNLIIDIRGNSGGNSLASNELLKRINCKNNIQLTNYYFYKKSAYTDKYINNYFPTLKQKNIMPDLKDIPIDNFNILEDDIILPHSDDSFRGKVYVLTDANIYSASEEFVNKVKRGHLATIIGTATGGDGIGTSPIILTLPNSKLCIMMGISMGVDSEGNINEKVHTQPDYYIEQSIADYRSALKNNIQAIENTKYDTVLNSLIKIITNK